MEDDGEIEISFQDVSPHHHTASSSSIGGGGGSGTKNNIKYKTYEGVNAKSDDGFGFDGGSELEGDNDMMILDMDKLSEYHDVLEDDDDMMEEVYLGNDSSEHHPPEDSSGGSGSRGGVGITRVGEFSYNPMRG